MNKLGFTQSWVSVANTFVTWADSTSTTTMKLIPDDSKITILDNTDGYFDSIDNRYDGIYNVNDSNGNQVTSNKLIIDRNILDIEKETVLYADEGKQQFSVTQKTLDSFVFVYIYIKILFIFFSNF